jgi:superfamily II DNA or RNA helicase
MNSLNTYLQTVGRGFRTHPGKTNCVIIDHGGNVHKHGWPTEDHEWSITDDRTVQERDQEKADREKKPPKPLVCPECGAVREKGPVCHVCGHQHKRTGLKVRTVNGELKELTQKKVRKKKEQTDLQKTWMTCVSIFANKGGTFKQAEWLFHKKTGQWPPDTVGPRPPEHQRGLRVRDIYPNWGRRR